MHAFQTHAAAEKEEGGRVFTLRKLSSLLVRVCTCVYVGVTAVRVKGFLHEEFGSDNASIIMAGGEVEKKKQIM